MKTEVAGQRPCISFTRGPVQFYSLGLDDMLQYHFDTGQKQKTVLVPGTMTINCCSRVDLESERLAWIIAEHLWLLREKLMKAGFFEIGRQPQITSPSPAGSLIAGDGADEWFATSITCPFQFYRTSQFTPLGENIVRSIETTLTARLNSFESKGWPGSGVSADLPAQLTQAYPPHFSPASDAAGGTPNANGVAPSLPLVPHPLNPAQLVSVRVVRPNRAGLKPASIGGRPIPLPEQHVEQSEPQVVVTGTIGSNKGT